MPQERALAAGVHHETRPGDAGSAVGRVTHSDRTASVKEHVHHLMALPDVHPVRPTVIQEQLVEEGAPDLVRVGILLIRLTEIPAPGRLLRAPDHGGTPFLYK